jgi:hypothetical protein
MLVYGSGRCYVQKATVAWGSNVQVLSVARYRTTGTGTRLSETH